MGADVVAIKIGSFAGAEVVAFKLSPQESRSVIGKVVLAKAAPASSFISPKNSDKLLAV